MTERAEQIEAELRRHSEWGPSPRPHEDRGPVEWVCRCGFTWRGANPAPFLPHLAEAVDGAIGGTV